jgi:hypothetical protein
VLIGIEALIVVANVILVPVNLSETLPLPLEHLIGGCGRRFVSAGRWGSRVGGSDVAICAVADGAAVAAAR